MALKSHWGWKRSIFISLHVNSRITAIYEVTVKSSWPKFESFVSCHKIRHIDIRITLIWLVFHVTRTIWRVGVAFGSRCIRILVIFGSWLYYTFWTSIYSCHILEKRCGSWWAYPLKLENNAVGTAQLIMHCLCTTAVKQGSESVGNDFYERRCKR